MTETSAGDALKQVQNGTLPIGSVEEILKKAPEDLVEETLEVPEWGCSVKVRSFTAAQAAMIRQRGIGFKGDETLIAWAEMEIMQFQQGVVEPAFSEDQVRELHLSSGRGFSRVIEKLDELSKIDKEALAKTREEFLRSKKSEEDGVRTSGEIESNSQ
jgi:hypothetical protein